MRPSSGADRTGFRGMMRINGKSAGTIYRVVVMASRSTYPIVEPRVYIDQQPEQHHWIRSGGQAFLCFQRTSVWKPTASTFVGQTRKTVFEMPGENFSKDMCTTEKVLS